MYPTIVPLAEMTRATPAPARALALSEDGDAQLIVLHDDETASMIETAGDTLVVLLCRDEHLSCAVDFRRARELLGYEVERARGGVVHLTSLYLYLAQLTNNGRAQQLVANLEATLSHQGIQARLPEGVRRSEAQERRTRAARAASGMKLRPRARRAVGTRSVGMLFALFGG